MAALRPQAIVHKSRWFVLPKIERIFRCKAAFSLHRLLRRDNHPTWQVARIEGLISWPWSSDNYNQREYRPEAQKAPDGWRCASHAAGARSRPLLNHRRVAEDAVIQLLDQPSPFLIRAGERSR